MTMNKPLLSDDLYRFAKALGATEPAFHGFNFSWGGKPLQVGIARIRNCPSPGIASYIGSLVGDSKSSRTTHIITGARLDEDISLCLAAFIAGVAFNKLRPRRGDAFVGVFEFNGSRAKMKDGVLVEPFPFTGISEMLGDVLYLLPITPESRERLINEGVDAFEAEQIESGRDVFDLV